MGQKPSTGHDTDTHHGFKQLHRNTFLTGTPEERTTDTSAAIELLGAARLSCTLS